MRAMATASCRWCLPSTSPRRASGEADVGRPGVTSAGAVPVRGPDVLTACRRYGAVLAVAEDQLPRVAIERVDAVTRAGVVKVGDFAPGRPGTVVRHLQEHAFCSDRIVL